MGIIKYLAVLVIFNFSHAGIIGNTVEVYVHSDGFHTWIVLPDTCMACPDSFIEYEYAEKKWYLDGQNQWYRVFPVLFTNTEGTIGEIRRANDDFPETSQFRFEFTVSDAQYLAMRKNIESWINRKVVYLNDGRSVYYGSTRSYNIFNSCYSFILKVLKAGGLDVNPRWGIFNRLTMWQLKKAEQGQKERR